MMCDTTTKRAVHPANATFWQHGAVSHQTQRHSPPHPDGPADDGRPGAGQGTGTAAAPETSAPSRPAPGGSWRQHAVRLLSGLLAAALGLGLLAVLVLLLWVASPAPQGGPEGALHVAAALWLTAHGAGLVRTSTITGEAVPVDLTPLLLAVLPLWLISRAVRHALADEPADGSHAARIAATVAAGYLLTGAAAVHYAHDGPLRADPLTAGTWLSATTAAVSAVVVWNALGRPGPVLRGPVVRSTVEACAAPVLRAAGLAATLLLAGGLLLLLLTLGLHGEEAWADVTRLSGNWSGRTAVVLLALALLPNAVVWAASYGLGPGFGFGAAGVVGPLGTGADADGALARAFPLFAALPADGPGPPLVWAVAAVPLAAGLAAGVSAGRDASPVAAPLPPGDAVEDTLDARETALTVCAAAVLCGAALAALAALAGGALGTTALAHVGPTWWATGAAAAVWTAVLGTPTALAVRAWRLRERGALAERLRWRLRWRRRLRLRRGDVPAAGDPAWHDSGARQSRWAALKAASGGLMNDFTPRGRD
jgi:hypothetical protein